MKPRNSSYSDYSSTESILAFKKKINTVTDKFISRVRVSGIPSALSTYARIVIKLLIELVGEDVFLQLVKKSV